MLKEQLKTKTYNKEVTETVLVSSKRFCDICGQEITGAHWKVITGHFELRDGCDESEQERDACSVNCLRFLFENYVKRSNGVHNTEYIEVYHEAWSLSRGDIKYE